MNIPDTERATLEAVMRQAESDLASAHEEICKLRNLDPKTHRWPDWTTASRSSVKIVSIVADKVNSSGELAAYDGLEAAREIRGLMLRKFNELNLTKK